MNEISSFFLVLSVGWFLLYWIFGGVFFSIVALVRLGRIYKARFGCLFTLLSAGMGALAAWVGLNLVNGRSRACVGKAVGTIHVWIEQFACGIVSYLGTFLIGFGVLVVIGFILMQLSKRTAPSWIEEHDPTKDEEEYELT